MNSKFRLIFLIPLTIGPLDLSAAETPGRDATYYACANVVAEGIVGAEFANRMYLSGLANGIIFGAKSSYERHDIAEVLPESPDWTKMIIESCETAIQDDSGRRSLHIFREEFFQILVGLGATGA